MQARIDLQTIADALNVIFNTDVHL